MASVRSAVHRSQKISTVLAQNRIERDWFDGRTQRRANRSSARFVFYVVLDRRNVGDVLDNVQKQTHESKYFKLFSTGRYVCIFFLIVGFGLDIHRVFEFDF